MEAAITFSSSGMYILMAYCTLRNETKPNQTKRNQAKPNETKPDFKRSYDLLMIRPQTLELELTQALKK